MISSWWFRWWMVSTIIIGLYFQVRDERVPLNPIDLILYCGFMPGLLTYLVSLLVWLILGKIFGGEFQ